MCSERTAQKGKDGPELSDTIAARKRGRHASLWRSLSSLGLPTPQSHATYDAAKITTVTSREVPWSSCKRDSLLVACLRSALPV